MALIAGRSCSLPIQRHLHSVFNAILLLIHHLGPRDHITDALSYFISFHWLRV